MTLHNWAGNIAFSTEQLHRPRSVEQLQELVAATPRIRPLGTRHSFNRIADTTGALVTVGDLNVPIEINEAARTVTLGAGIRYGELTSLLQERGWALHNLGSLPHISVAGACATGTHGSGVTNPALASAVTGIEFVDGRGELICLDRGDAPFPGAVVALGALGVVTRITLQIEPTYRVRQDVWLDAPFGTVAEQLDEVMASGYSVSLFTHWSERDTFDQIWVKARDGDAVADGRAWGARPAEIALHPIAGQDAAAATEQLGVPGAWNERLPHFRLAFTPSAGDEQQTEYLLPREHGRAALEAVRGLDIEAALHICEIRTVAADDLWLSPSYGRDTIALHFTWVNDDAVVHRAVTAAEAALAPFDPRPHWGKVFLSDPSARYSRLRDFRELVGRYDPEHRFGNEFLESFVYT